MLCILEPWLGWLGFAKKTAAFGDLDLPVSLACLFTTFLTG